MLREHSSSRKAFSAIFVYVTTAGTVYTEQKQKKWGREKNLKFCMLETYWLKFNTSRGQSKMKELISESHMQKAFSVRHNTQQFSFAPWIKKVIPQI